MTTYEYLEAQRVVWEGYRNWEELYYKASEQPIYQTLTSNTDKIIFPSQPHPTNCPNCGAALKTGTCEYCDSKIY